jgi:hypothetical protein
MPTYVLIYHTDGPNVGRYHEAAPAGDHNVISPPPHPPHYIPRFVVTSEPYTRIAHFIIHLSGQVTTEDTRPLCSAVGTSPPAEPSRTGVGSVP